MTTINKSEASSYPLYGQDPMTERERAAFLQAARDQEKAYDNFVARSNSNAKASADYPHEHLPDIDDPQHRLETDYNHPITIRRALEIKEKMLATYAEKLEKLEKPAPVWGDPDYKHDGERAELQATYDEIVVATEKDRASLSAAYAARASTIEDVPAYLNAMPKPSNDRHSFYAYLTDVVDQQNKDQGLKASDVLHPVPQTAPIKPLVSGGHVFDDYLASFRLQANFAERIRAGEAQVAREKEEWLATNRSAAQASSVERDSAKPWSNPRDIASPLFIEDRTRPTHIAWHKQAGVNSYQTPISEVQLARTSGSASRSNASAASSTQQSNSYAQAGEVNNSMQLAAAAPQSIQTDELPTPHGSGVRASQAAGGVLSILPVATKAAITHTLAPLGTEAIYQADTALEVLNKAEKDFAKGSLTKEQLSIIDSNTKATAAEASAAAIIPEPGFGMDKIVQVGDQKLVAELVQAGLSKQQSQQYEMGSMIESGHRLAAFVGDSLANKGDVKQIMDDDGAIPLSMALNITPTQLKQFGAMSETLGGEALKAEVARNPAFEGLAHLSAQKIEKLSQMTAAGIDPLVMDFGHITTTSNRPTQLSADSKTAFMESANYIMLSGDVGFRVPGNRPVELKATVENFANTYQHLAQDGGLSSQDKAVLKMTMDTLSKGIEANQLQGVVAKYESSHLPPGAANDAEHAVSMQR